MFHLSNCWLHRSISFNVRYTFFARHWFNGELRSLQKQNWLGRRNNWKHMYPGKYRCFWRTKAPVPWFYDNIIDCSIFYAVHALNKCYVTSVCVNKNALVALIDAISWLHCVSGGKCNSAPFMFVALSKWLFTACDCFMVIVAAIFAVDKRYLFNFSMQFCVCFVVADLHWHFSICALCPSDFFSIFQ